MLSMLSTYNTSAAPGKDYFVNPTFIVSYPTTWGELNGVGWLLKIDLQGTTLARRVSLWISPASQYRVVDTHVRH